MQKLGDFFLRIDRLMKFLRIIRIMLKIWYHTKMLAIRPILGTIIIISIIIFIIFIIIFIHCNEEEDEI